MREEQELYQKYTKEGVRDLASSRIKLVPCRLSSDMHDELPVVSSESLDMTSGNIRLDLYSPTRATQESQLSNQQKEFEVGFLFYNLGFGSNKLLE